MRTDKKVALGLFGVFGLWFALIAAFWGTVIYVVMHFLMKLW